MQQRSQLKLQVLSLWYGMGQIQAQTQVIGVWGRGQNAFLVEQ